MPHVKTEIEVMGLLIQTGVDTLLRDLVQERTGMTYNNNKEPILIEKLSPLIIERGFQSVLDYYYLLKYDENADEEWSKVIDAISVRETYFWREMEQVRAFVDTLVPEWARQTENVGPLRIWSAACATGEEPLTLAMALREAGWFDKIQIEIIATDASRAAIEKAREGVYRERAFRNLPFHIRNKYFAKVDNGWRIDPELQKLITWDVANLISKQETARFARVPFIFCRNVFIYFSSATVGRVARYFAEYMQSPGYLFVGVSESLLKNTMEFELLDIGKAFVYKRSTRDRLTSLRGLVMEVKGHK